MSGITVELRKNRRTGKEESQEQLLKRFIKKCKNENLMKEVKSKEYYVKPGDKKRLKRVAAAKRRAKEARQERKRNQKRRGPKNGKRD